MDTPQHWVRQLSTPNSYEIAPDKNNEIPRQFHTPTFSEHHGIKIDSIFENSSDLKVRAQNL